MYLIIQIQLDTRRQRVGSKIILFYVIREQGQHHNVLCLNKHYKTENYKCTVNSLSFNNCVIFVPYFLIAYDFAVFLFCLSSFSLCCLCD